MLLQSNLNFGKLEAQNMRIQNLGSAPGSPVEGQCYYDTALHQFGVYQNSTWVYLTSGGGSGDVTQTSNSSGANLIKISAGANKVLADYTGTGILKATSGAIGTATAGTDYAAATSGTSILKGDGSGGFSSAKYTATIGDGSTTAIVVTDSLGTIDKMAICRDASTNAQIIVDITYATNTTTFTFATAPASNAYKVVIIG